MKKIKKGFTLIEIIGIIILLGLIAVLVYPTIIRLIGDSEDDLYKKNVQEVERLAANWASINEDKLPKVDKRGYYLKLEEMKNEGFIANDIINPKTGETMQGCVGIIYDGNKNRHTYKYFENCDNFVKPILSKINTSTIENEYGWRNKDFYVTLESKYLDYYDYCIGDTKCEPSIRVNNANDQILINQEGIKYVCAKGINTVDETSTECILYRLDKTKPVVGNIVFTGTQGLDNWYVSDVKVTTTKSTDSLSGIASNTLSPTETSVTVDTKGKTYTLIARDLAGNESSVSYSVKLDKTAPTIGELVINGTKGKNDWWTSNLTFNVTDGNDSISGHINTSSSLSGLTTETKGTKVTVKTMNGAGLVSTKDYTIKMDKTAPTPGTLTISGTAGNNGWYRSDVTFKVNNGSDNISSHSSTISTHTGISKETSGTKVTVTTENQAGLTATRDYTIKIDKTAPTTPTSMNFVFGNWGQYTDNTWTNQSIYAASTTSNPGPSGSSDTTSGLWKYQISTDKVNWVDYNYTASGIYLMSTDGVHTRYFRAVDNAGNVSGIISRTAKVDKTAPTTPTSMNFVFGNWGQYTDNTWTNQSIYAASTTSNPGPSGSSDTTSGLWKYQISTDKVNWVDYNYTASGIYLMSTDGVHTRYFRAVDNAGNVSDVISRTAKVDKTAPTIAFGISGDLGKTAVINCSDTLSGIATSSKQTTQTLSGTADKTIQGSCTDQAGNSATDSHTYKYNSCKTGSNTCTGGYVETNCSSCYYGSPSECQGGYVQGSCKKWVNRPCGSGACDTPNVCYSNTGDGKSYCAACSGYYQVWDDCVSVTPDTCSYGCDSEYDSCATGSNTCQGGFNLN